MRRDAQRNRDALVAAARQELAERGMDAPLEAVARRAGVAIGTLYRHFPERADLMDAILAEKLASWTRMARSALEQPSPWDALVFFLERTCEQQSTDRALTQLACVTDSESLDRTEISQVIELLLERARAAGVVRADLDTTDLAYFVLANSRVAEADPSAWRRHFDLSLGSLRP
ncbi:TetR/AcrR family transcriptional regulator [Nonomuraea sp. NPDC050556]|uniref:TetR/AcrR family transcriptional regulator n=1 Tax=Nonomuraea sp. NPDC050556 TaxID=3364369 RepID=UPI0037A4ED15